MTSVRKMLALHGIRPRKSLGQSFLEDMNIVRRIVELSGPAGDETVVEIGAGLGFMTEALAKKAGRVIALEVDPRLAAILRERFAGDGRVEVLRADVLNYDFSSACRGARIKVVGNVPYHISSPILFRLLEFRRFISDMTLMFQRELADRITASPGGKDYGIPSVMVERYTRVTCGFTVPRTCFYPAPDVTSSVLRMVVRPDTDLSDGALFTKIVRTAFSRRRKTLWNNLRRIAISDDVVERVFNMSGIDRVRRAETLSVEEFSKLTKAWIENAADGIRPQHP
ncbi:MAG: 16S rRNA (adenine(1518)-N(6)/adenine(1519)-N(6))-dimethyltransferase RsmA [Deltaproteobacteria bacterium]|nr:16S rRNA (adenine(1518)-N(6)/adenine(1519)-N(6))-dimethyltransferase RsmA [Deltaproteobacteria bacterium]